MFRHRVHTLDLRRAQERVAVHFDGDAAAVLDYNRLCVPARSADKLAEIIKEYEHKATDPQSDIIGVRNRFATPSAWGYRDFSFLHRNSANGFISTGRIVAIPYEEDTFFATAESFWSSKAIEARLAMSARGLSGPVVVIADNYRRDDDHSCILVHGFSNRAIASEYARCRFKDSVRVLIKQPCTVESLRADWLTLGEDAGIFDEAEGYSYLGPLIRSVIAEMSIKDPREYWDIETEYNLRKFSLPGLEVDE